MFDSMLTVAPHTSLYTRPLLRAARFQGLWAQISSSELCLKSVFATVDSLCVWWPIFEGCLHLKTDLSANVLRSRRSLYVKNLFVKAVFGPTFLRTVCKDCLGTELCKDCFFIPLYGLLLFGKQFLELFLPASSKKGYAARIGIWRPPLKAYCFVATR